MNHLSFIIIEALQPDMERKILSDYSHHLLSLGILCSIPATLAALHTFTPHQIQEQFVFQYSDPSVLTAWTSAYFHSDTSHLQSNLIGYAIAIFPTYFLYDYWDRRRRFWVIVVLLLVITPLVTALISYTLGYLQWEIFIGEITSRGFSGIASAFGGMLLGGVTLFSATEYGWLNALNVTMTIILVGMIILTYVSGILTPTIGGLLIIGILGTTSVFLTVDDVKDRSHLRSRVRENRVNLFYIVYCGFVVSAVIAMIFPLNVVQDDIFVNIIAHGSGFVSGALITFIVGSLSTIDTR